MEEQTLRTTRDVCRLAACSYRQLDYWCRIGLVEPALAARGSGSARLFDADDVADVRAISDLLRFGLGLGVIRRLSDVQAANAAIRDVRSTIEDLLVDA